ncbi:MAG TPA: TPM domain-containing protein [Methanomassiliicoccales archaeon]|nr:TPM domain-containing protein [Methanomassiliicoccales archaeon]
MDRGKRVAFAAAAVICIVILAVGAFLILGAGAPKEDTSWVPTITPYVDDRAGVLNYSDYQDLDNFCYAVEQNNSCQIAVLIVNTTQPVGVNDYAIKVFEKNGIGQAGKDNGVLFVYSADEKAWRVVTGAGVSDILNGARLTDLASTYLTPELEAGNYSNGILLFVYAIGLDLVDNYHSTGTGDSTDYPISFIPLTWWQWALILVVVMGLTVVTKGRFLMWLGYIILAFVGRGGSGGWGGGKTGGGGARGRL